MDGAQDRGAAGLVEAREGIREGRTSSVLSPALGPGDTLMAGEPGQGGQPVSCHIVGLQRAFR